MNYLAHFYLSFDQEALVVGNLLGDFVRGRIDHPRNNALPDGIKQGVMLHRHIDFFTDTNPIAAECRRALPSTFAGYSGVVTDMFFDYFLAKNFSKYHRVPLADFAQNVYQILDKNKAHIPEKGIELVTSMTRYNWLTHYALMEGMRRSFLGMSKKYHFLGGIEKAHEELEAKEDFYEQKFFEFFTQLTESCQSFLEE